MFQHTSRYHRVGDAKLTLRNGRTVTYKKLRVIPQKPPPTQSVAVVRADDRPDLVAARTLGDPLQYWRIADANGVLDPFALTAKPGARIAIPAVRFEP